MTTHEHHRKNLLPWVARRDPLRLSRLVTTGIEQALDTDSPHFTLVEFKLSYLAPDDRDSVAESILAISGELPKFSNQLEVTYDLTEILITAGSERDLCCWFETVSKWEEKETCFFKLKQWEFELK